jgi:putative methyltransferase
MYHGNDSSAYFNPQKLPLYFGLAALYLKTYIDTERKDIANQLEWQLPIQELLSDEELINEIINNNIDLLCTSHYVWNNSILMDQLTRIHSQLPYKVKIIIGGPSMNAHHDPSFFEKYPFVDYAIYAAGEHAFADIIESILHDKKLIPFNTSNLLYFDNEQNKVKKANYKYVNEINTSPYLHCAEMLEQLVRKYENKYTVVLSYELTRGCPYSCTFCDWNAGFDNKVTRRKNTYQQEIDLFQKLKIKNLYLADANVGQYEEDIEMIEYMMNKNISENAGFLIDANFSKLRKENNMKIYRLLGKGRGVTNAGGFVISVQDVNKEVLKNINRPDVGWEVHEQMIYDLRKEFPNISCRIQLIQGLPGQTVESWRKTLGRVIKTGATINIFINELLENSPAGRDDEYKKKYKVVYSNSQRLGSAGTVKITDENKVYFRGNFAESSSTFSKEDTIKMTMLSYFYGAISYLKVILENTDVHIDVEHIVDDFLESEYYTQLYNNLHNNWFNHDKYVFTTGFSTNPIWNVEYAACRSLIDSIQWAISADFLKFCLKYHPKDLREELINKYVDDEHIFVLIDPIKHVPHM